MSLGVNGPAPLATSTAVRVSVAEPAAGPLPGEWGSGGASLLLRDATSLFLMLSEGRRRLIMRMFAVPEDQVGLVTLVAFLVLAQFVQNTAARVTTAPAVPASGDTALAIAAVREAGHLLAGDASRDTPLLVPLVAFALFGTLVRPVLGIGFRDVRAWGHRARLGFDHRYGHLVRRNRPHQRID